MTNEKPGLVLVRGGETEEERMRRQVAEMRSQNRRAWARMWGCFLLAIVLLLGGAYVAVEVNTLVGTLVATAYVAPIYAMLNGDDDER